MLRGNNNAARVARARLSVLDRMRRFEVAIICSLPPHAGEVFYLEVSAYTERGAVAVADKWVARTPAGWQNMRLVRDVSAHQLTVTALGASKLWVNWAVPVSSMQPEGDLVMHPTSGLPVGFLADDETEFLCLDERMRRQFRLILRQPMVNAAPVCVVPMMKLVTGY